MPTKGDSGGGASQNRGTQPASPDSRSVMIELMLKYNCVLSVYIVYRPIDSVDLYQKEYN